MLFLIGTVRKNKSFVPKQMLPSNSRLVNSSVFGFQREATLVSYVPKRNRAVLLLSTFHHDAQVSTDSNDNNKPTIIMDYNHNKGGVDTLDQVVRTYSCRRKTRRWPFLMFANIVDIAAYNAYLLFLFVHPQYKNRSPHRRRQFLIELAKSMLPNISESPQISSMTRSIVGSFNNNAGANVKPGRCNFCPRNADKKTPHSCSKCHKRVCKVHSKLFCQECI